MVRRNQQLGSSSQLQLEALDATDKMRLTTLICSIGRMKRLQHNAEKLWTLRTEQRASLLGGSALLLGANSY